MGFSNKLPVGQHSPCVAKDGRTSASIKVPSLPRHTTNNTHLRCIIMPSIPPSPVLVSESRMVYYIILPGCGLISHLPSLSVCVAVGHS